MNKSNDYELRSAKLRQSASREASGWCPPARPHKVRRPKAPKPDLWWVAQQIVTAVGNAVPDGDPIDVLGPLLATRYDLPRWDVGKLLDRAARDYLDVKSYDAYLVEAWDAYNEAVSPEERIANPWRPA